MNAHLTDARADTSVLGLGAILVDSLPRTLFTDHEPARYAVDAVFTRRPDAEEVAAIAGTETQHLLETAGYGAVTLTVSDRRLTIANTNLGELRNGLSSLIATLLDELSVEAIKHRAVKLDQLRADAAAEQRRLTEVAEAARSIAFVPEVSRSTDDHWSSEGGAEPS